MLRGYDQLTRKKKHAHVHWTRGGNLFLIVADERQIGFVGRWRYEVASLPLPHLKQPFLGYDMIILLCSLIRLKQLQQIKKRKALETTPINEQHHSNLRGPCCPQRVDGVLVVFYCPFVHAIKSPPFPPPNTGICCCHCHESFARRGLSQLGLRSVASIGVIFRYCKQTRTQ